MVDQLLRVARNSFKADSAISVGTNETFAITLCYQQTLYKIENLLEFQSRNVRVSGLLQAVCQL
jgi:hypothetical protein